MSLIIPNNCHTVFIFNLPFPIPVPDGIYEVKIGIKIAKIAIKRIQRNKTGNIQSNNNFQIKFDKYGKSSYSSVNVRLPWIVNFEEKGRIIQSNTQPNNKAKEQVLRFLNRFIETSRYVTEEFWVEPARYQDLVSYKAFYYDGKNKYPTKLSEIDSKSNEIGIKIDHPFKLSDEKLSQLNNSLKNEIELDPSKIFLMNSKNACLQEDFRLAIIQSVIALEIILYQFIKCQGEKLKIPAKTLNSSIKEIGLTGNILPLLKMLTIDQEQIDIEIIRDCKGAIKIRNKIIHQGFRDIHSTDTENRIIAIEQMINYLMRFILNTQKV
ncbi:MAG: hypothetical protein KGD70_15455 [Candidatus Lokiarchaeota archaeon]|nr:hypothetical protein [Candidatus Bathyarchaeota archaeon]MBY9013768.1 hypothetical protein [Candidatus Lokiarchaeota archaeon]